MTANASMITFSGSVLEADFPRISCSSHWDSPEQTDKPQKMLSIEFAMFVCDSTYLSELLCIFHIRFSEARQYRTLQLFRAIISVASSSFLILSSTSISRAYLPLATDMDFHWNYWHQDSPLQHQP
ncbi:hypothetical protein CC77DRAFT_532539 [Alternaria alternata]|uniref:Uncharacterized protein n=1 Tax=Alternaria alternata TaxID=5599 RepID=A0A177DZG6_ALTAL|nr:hypothetical protein CC77DRAFT_532539 [Alternaria alternata]OAG24571.1 hypothetical protein CC77DRAFT_532539 [Alternaria alternata]